jgi:type I restriction enzyme S subunit
MNLIEKYFDIAFSAPDGIKKLRSMILTLAMQGKLDTQDPTDKPAIELLKGIQTEKERLIRAGKLKKQNPLTPIGNKVQFETPKGWEWVKLGEIFSFEYGDSLPAEKRSNSGEFPVYGSNGVVGSHNKAFVHSPCIVIGRKGSAGALNVCETQGCCVTDVAYYLVPPKEIDLFFSFYLLKTLDLESLGKGIKPGLNRNEAYDLVIPVVPEAEQLRIVERIKILMTRCDELEKLRNEKEQKLLSVHSGAINALLNSNREKDFNASWQFITKNFPELYSVKENVIELRKAILQLAVMGKLVPQDPKDKPASDLLKEIQAEKEKLMKRGELKKQKPLPLITEKERPFQIPMGWEWVRLGDLTQVITKGSSPNWQGVEYTDEKNGILFITSENVGNYKVLLDKKKYVDKKFNKIEPRSILKKNDILMNIVGASIGRTAIFELDDIANINQAVTIIRLFSFLNHTYFLHFFNSPVCISYMFDKQVDNARANLSMGNIALFPIPVPPRSEQKKINEKINSLMSFCDDLEKKIAETDKIKTSLLSAITV